MDPTLARGYKNQFFREVQDGLARAIQGFRSTLDGARPKLRKRNHRDEIFELCVTQLGDYLLHHCVVGGKRHPFLCLYVFEDEPQRAFNTWNEKCLGSCAFVLSPDPFNVFVRPIGFNISEHAVQRIFERTISGNLSLSHQEQLRLITDELRHAPLLCAFWTIEGFSLDDYKPFSDVSSSLDRLVRFMSAAVADRQQRLVKCDQETYDLVSIDGVRRARFSLNRDTAAASEDVQLMGLDHPLMQEELGRWRSVPPEEIGIAVSGGVAEPVLLSFWMVEASASNGERRVVVQPIAVKQDGTRLPVVERQCERYLQMAPTTPKFSPQQRIDLFASVVEPTLQRELKHKGAANGDGSYSADLIGYVEIC